LLALRRLRRLRHLRCLRYLRWPKGWLLLREEVAVVLPVPLLSYPWVGHSLLSYWFLAVPAW
jgi:hypothetical protein